MTEKRSWDDIPEECWELILSHLNHHLEPISLLSKRFLTISNRLKSVLTITDPTILIHRSISKLLRRFSHLKRINIVEFHGDLDQLIREISQSNLPHLQALNISRQKRIPVDSLTSLGKKVNLKILLSSYLSVLQDSDLNLIASSFPNLEELDISYPEQDLGSNWNIDLVSGIVTDDGIANLARNLPNLRKVNLSGNHFISDRSLVAISTYCKVLSEIVIRDCSFVGQEAVSAVMRHCPNLNSLSLNENKAFPSLPRLAYPSIESSFAYTKVLRVLDFSQMFISDEFLNSVALVSFPLEKLVLSHCTGFTLRGMSSLLHTHRGLKYLDLSGGGFLTDQSVEYLSQYLHELTYISLNLCLNLTSSTFLALSKNCPSLVEIRMGRTSLGMGDFPNGLGNNRNLRSLKLASNKCLTDDTLTKLVSHYPELRSLDVSFNWSLTEKGMQEIGRSCREITELEVNACAGVTNLGKDTEFPKLEVLRASNSGIDDRGLAMIGDHCTGLQCLIVQGCFGVSEKGVKDVVKKCKRLKEVSLKYCDGKSEVLAWMVFTRPSLRKITPPYGVVPTGAQRDLFMHHGCMVVDV